MTYIVIRWIYRVEETKLINIWELLSVFLSFVAKIFIISYIIVDQNETRFIDAVMAIEFLSRLKCCWLLLNYISD